MIDLIDTLIDSLTGTAEALVTVLTSIPLLLASVLYVLTGLTLTFLCRAARKGSVWMAWVPFANLYLLGLMADIYTDDRVLRGEIDPRYAPSTLRRKMLSFSIVQSVFGSIAGVAVLISLFSGFAGLLTGFFGGLFDQYDVQEGANELLGVFAVSLLIFLVTAAVFVVFYILYAVSACKAHYRLFFMLGTPLPALWSAAVIFIPPLAAVMLFVFTVKNHRVLTEKFFPPMEDPRAEDGEAPPPAAPPMPELYQL
ncbi:MAG: hypothetical protein IJ363_12115 [Clostridia bacterium]|nr:hypothetical protein [Clostridia bacterium]